MPIASRVEPKPVAIIFADLYQHMALWSKLPAGEVRRVIVAYDELVGKLLEKHPSVASKFLGDGHMVLFETPDVAVSFAIRLIEGWNSLWQKRFTILEAKPLRLGGHYGPVYETGRGEFIGVSIGIAKRIEDQANPGTLFVSRTLADQLDLPRYEVRETATTALEGDTVPQRELYGIAGIKKRPPRKPTVTADDWFLRAIALVGTPDENSEKEARYYREALRLKPEFPEAHYNYAILLEAMGRPKEAEQHYIDALRLKPGDPEIHTNYANLLEAMGRLKEAEQHYQKALRLNPNNPEMHTHYANLLQAMGRPKEAEKHYKEAS